MTRAEQVQADPEVARAVVALAAEFWRGNPRVERALRGRDNP